jgi:hypothetical protein
MRSPPDTYVEHRPTLDCYVDVNERVRLRATTVYDEALLSPKRDA